MRVLRERAFPVIVQRFPTRFLCNGTTHFHHIQTKSQVDAQLLYSYSVLIIRDFFLLVYAYQVYVKNTLLPKKLTLGGRSIMFFFFRLFLIALTSQVIP